MFNQDDLIEQLYVDNAIEGLKDDKIRYISIEHGILTDAPFIGARICAIKCHHNCPGCFNAELNKANYNIATTKEVIDEILKHPINEGIILAGLNWIEQPQEMLSLICYALFMNLKIMIYTYLTIDKFMLKFPYLGGHKILVKCGEYKKDLPQYYDSKYDVVLASNNQKIYDMRYFHEGQYGEN